MGDGCGMKTDLKSSNFYWMLLRVALLCAAVVLFLAPMVWVSSVGEYTDITVTGRHILLGSSVLQPALNEAGLDPQGMMQISFLLLAGAMVLSFIPKKTFFPVALIIFSVALAWLSVHHYGWLEKSKYALSWGFGLYALLAAAAIGFNFVGAGLSRLNVGTGEFKSHMALLAMLIPGLVFLIVFAYLPMPGVLIAFKNFKVYGRSLFENFFKSAWAGFDNFGFIFSTPDARTMTINTVLYNLAFIALGLVASVSIAVGITEISNRKTAKVYQTMYFLPYFLSWVVVSYLVYALLNYEYGVINNLLRATGFEPVDWYMEPNYWPVLFVIANLWKYAGNGSIIYTATIVGIDSALYEAAAIDGANRFKQIRHITLPMLKPTIILLNILAMGRIFNADFGLFYLLTRGMGQLRNVSMVIDTFVYGALASGNITLGRVSAAALYQSVVGFILILATNWIVSRISPDNTLL